MGLTNTEWLKWVLEVNCMCLRIIFLWKARSLSIMPLPCARVYYNQEGTTLVPAFCLAMLKAFSNLQSFR